MARTVWTVDGVVAKEERKRWLRVSIHSSEDAAWIVLEVFQRKPWWLFFTGFRRLVGKTSLNVVEEGLVTLDYTSQVRLPHAFTLENVDLEQALAVMANSIDHLTPDYEGIDSNHLVLAHKGCDILRVYKQRILTSRGDRVVCTLAIVIGNSEAVISFAETTVFSTLDNLRRFARNESMLRR